MVVDSALSELAVEASGVATAVALVATGDPGIGEGSAKASSEALPSSTGSGTSSGEVPTRASLSPTGVRVSIAIMGGQVSRYYLARSLLEFVTLLWSDERWCTRLSD